MIRHHPPGRLAPWRACLVAGAALIAGDRAAAAEGAPIADGAVKMAIVYNLGKFIDWPAGAFAGAAAPFTLCVLGPTERIRDGLDAIETRSVHGRALTVRQVVHSGEFPGCQILYLVDPEARRLPEQLSAAHALGILTVSDAEHFAEDGGGVALLLVENRVRFAVNLNATQAANLRISSELLHLAQHVIGAPRT
jgi:hypothetical protein